MLDEAVLTDPLRCPSCATELGDGADFCPSCHLSMRAPHLLRVWQLSHEITTLAHQREALLQQARLYTARLSDELGTPDPPPAEVPEQRAQSQTEAPAPEHEPLSPGDVVVEKAAFADPEVAREVEAAVTADSGSGPNAPDIGVLSVRSLLLGVGVVLLAIAALIFTAVAWGKFGDTGRAAVLGLVTSLSATGAVYAVRRGLSATGEALSALSVALLLVDAYALRSSGLGESTLDGSTYWAVATASIAALALAASRLIRVVPRLSAGVLAQFPMPLLVGGVNSATALALMLGGQALGLVVLEARWGSAVSAAGRRVSVAMRVIAGGGAAAAFVYALTRALGVALGVDAEPRGLGSLTLALLALVPWTVAWLHSGFRELRHAGSGLATGLVLLGAITALGPLRTPGPWIPPAAAVLALLAVLAARRLPRPVRPGPLAATTVFAGGALVAVAIPLLTLVLSPLTWWLNPWAVSPLASARNVLSIGSGDVVSPGDVLGAGPDALPAIVTGALVAAIFALLARALRPPPPDHPADRRADGTSATRASQPSSAPTGIIDQRYAGSVADLVGTATAIAIPTGLPLPHILAISLQLGLAGVLLLRPAALTKQLSTSSRFTAVVGTLALILSLSWSVAAEGSTLWAIAVAVCLLALGAMRSPERERHVFAAAAVMMACGEVGAIALSLQAPRSLGAAVAALVAAGIAVLAGLLGTENRRGAEVGAGSAYAVALLLVGTPAGTGWVALAGAVAAAAVALHRDRRPAAALSGGLACAAAACLAYAAGRSGATSALVVSLVAAVVVLLGTHVLLVRPGDEAPGDDELPSAVDTLDELRGAARATEVTGGIAYFAAVLLRLASWDLGELAMLFAIGGVTAGLVSVRRERRGFWRLSLALLTAASWAAFWAYDVRALEPYTVPPAIALLVVGFLRRRTEPHTDSWRAYASGLALGLLPSLVMAFLDDGLVRPLLLGAAAVITLLIGARYRLQAPLAFGAAVVSLDALNQVAPYADVLGPWATVGAAGLLLLAMGATCDRRLRDIRQLQERFGRLG